MKKLAIIGAGIGGSSLAYYLRDSEYACTIYESRKEVGGRIRNSEVHGQIVETGAAFFHGANRYLMSFINELGIETEQVPSDTYGLWDGKKMVFQTGNSSLMNYVRLVLRYGLRLLNLRKGIKVVKANVQQFYERDEIFDDIPGMIHLMGADSIYTKSIEQTLVDMGVSEKIIAELAIPSSRYIYHQCGRRSMNGFAGFVSLIASDGAPIYRIKQGNKTLVKRLIEASTCTLNLGVKVKSITQKNDKYEIESNNGTELFDAVVIATPLEVSNIDLKEMEEISSELDANRSYVRYYKTLVAGTFNPSYFQTEHIPHMVMCKEDSDAPMFAMSSKGFTRDGTPVWSMTSDTPIPREELEKIFDNIKSVEEVSVPYTYPELEAMPFDDFAPMKLADTFFYISSVDSFSPTMESSIIVARNMMRILTR